MRPITILLAAYKGNEYAGAMIDSILAQDSDDWQLVLSDDGTDTAELLECYARAYPDRIVHHRSGRRFGSAQKHFLYLMEQYKDSPYLMFCDQDDVWHPDKVRKTFALMKKAEDETKLGSAEDMDREVPRLVHTDLRVVDRELKEMKDSFMAFSRLDGTRLAFNELLIQNVVTGCTLMINRPLTELALMGAGREEMRMHDWWIALCAAAFGEALYLPEATIDYRQHGDNSVGAKDPRSLSYVKDKLKGGYVKEERLRAAAQAGAFAEVYGGLLSAKQKEAALAMASLGNRNKLGRLYVYSKYSLWKKDPARKIGQFIWG